MSDRDLAGVVHEVLQTHFPELTVDEAVKILIDLACANVEIYLQEYVDQSEHGMQIVFAHGNDCEGCRMIQSMAFDAIRGSRDDGD
jgi:hypothetical protein